MKSKIVLFSAAVIVTIAPIFINCYCHNYKLEYEQSSYISEYYNKYKNNYFSNNINGGNDVISNFEEPSDQDEEDESNK